MPKHNNTYALRLRKKRETMHMTQLELANKAGISESCYNRVERGEYNISVRILKKIADTLGLELEIRFNDKLAEDAERGSN